MSQTVTAVQVPAPVNRIDGHTNYASYDFIVESGVTVNYGDFVYFSGGYVTNASVSGSTELVGMAQGTVTGDGTLTVKVLTDPNMVYLLEASAALAQTNVGQFFDIKSGSATQIDETSAANTVKQFVCLAVGPSVNIAGIAEGTDTSSYGLFKIAQSFLRGA